MVAPNRTSTIGRHLVAPAHPSGAPRSTVLGGAGASPHKPSSVGSQSPTCFSGLDASIASSCDSTRSATPEPPANRTFRSRPPRHARTGAHTHGLQSVPPRPHDENLSPLTIRLSHKQRGGMALIVGFAFACLATTILFCPPLAALIPGFIAALPAGSAIFVCISASVGAGFMFFVITPSSYFLMRLRNRGNLHKSRADHMSGQSRDAQRRLEDERNAFKARCEDLEERLAADIAREQRAAEAEATRSKRASYEDDTNPLKKYLTALTVVLPGTMVAEGFEWDHDAHATAGVGVLDAETEHILESHPHLRGFLHPDCIGKTTSQFEGQLRGVHSAYQAYGTDHEMIHLQPERFYSIRQNGAGFVVTGITVEAKCVDGTWKILYVQNQFEVFPLASSEDAEWGVTSGESSFHELYTCQSETELDDVARAIQNTRLHGFFPAEGTQRILDWRAPLGSVTLPASTPLSIKLSDAFYTDAQRDGLISAPGFEESFFAHPWLALALNQRTCSGSVIHPSAEKHDTSLGSSQHFYDTLMMSCLNANARAERKVEDAKWHSPGPFFKIEPTENPNRAKVTHWVVEGISYPPRDGAFPLSYLHVRKNVVLVSRDAESGQLTSIVDPSSSRALYACGSEYALRTTLTTLQREFAEQFPETLLPPARPATQGEAAAADATPPSFRALCSSHFRLAPDPIRRQHAWRVFARVAARAGFVHTIPATGMVQALTDADEIAQVALAKGREAEAAKRTELSATVSARTLEKRAEKEIRDAGERAWGGTLKHIGAWHLAEGEPAQVTRAIAAMGGLTPEARVHEIFKQAIQRMNAREDAENREAAVAE